MKFFFQLGINCAVVFMVIYFFIWPFIWGLLPYTDDTIPDETARLDAEIDDFLLTLKPVFAEEFENPSHNGQYSFKYYDGERTALSPQDNYQESVKSVVYITVEDYDGWIYYGSGTILTEDGVVMTNSHVLEGAVKVVVTTYDGQHYEATDVLASDDVLDIDIIKINATGLTPIAIGDSSQVEVGDETLVIGHAEGLLNTLSLGNVSGIRRYEAYSAEPLIQITNPVSSGNSGGAVINEYGELIAIPSWSIEYDDNSVQVQNLNFAVPVNEALSLIN